MKLVLKIVLVLFIIPLAAGFGIAWRHYCPAISGVTVSVNGVQTLASVNRCPNRLVLVSMPGEIVVLVDRAHQRALASGGEFHEGFGFVFSHDLNPQGVSLNDRVKIERDTELRFFENGLSYRDIMSGDEIVINFNDVKQSSY